MGFLTSLWRRVARLMRSHSDAGLDDLDPEAFQASVRQAVGGMRVQLNEVVRSCAEAMSAYNRLEWEDRNQRREAGLWADRAREALASGNEDAARKALARKEECERRLASLGPTLEAARRASEELRSHVARLRLRVEDAERRASTLIARRNAAAAQKKIAKALAASSQSDDAFSALGLLEASVADDETEALAWDELRTVLADDLEREFEALRRPGLEAVPGDQRIDALPPPTRRDGERE